MFWLILKLFNVHVYGPCRYKTIVDHSPYLIYISILRPQLSFFFHWRLDGLWLTLDVMLSFYPLCSLWKGQEIGYQLFLPLSWNLQAVSARYLWPNWRGWSSMRTFVYWFWYPTLSLSFIVFTELRTDGFTINLLNWVVELWEYNVWFCVCFVKLKSWMKFFYRDLPLYHALYRN